jgi:hypothetical protein
MTAVMLPTAAPTMADVDGPVGICVVSVLELLFPDDFALLGSDIVGSDIVGTLEVVLCHKL